jgi:hypothetical protein
MKETTILVKVPESDEDRYQLLRPISDDLRLRGEGSIVSTHQSLDAARAALSRSRRGAKQQGGYSQDYIWDRVESRVIPEWDD